MIHHVSTGTNDVPRARMFYDAVPPTAGLAPIKATETAADYGSCQLSFSVETPVEAKSASVGNGGHFAFAAENHTMVQRLHEAATADQPFEARSSM